MRIFTCDYCTKIHIEIGNILLHFASKNKLEQYLNELDNIDAEYFAKVNLSKPFSKDIFLQVPGTNMNLSFTVKEFTMYKENIRKYLQPQKNVFLTSSYTDICMN